MVADQVDVKVPVPEATYTGDRGIIGELEIFRVGR